MSIKYSVLISVYEKEKPEYLQAALSSIINQTLPPDEIIQVCDGPLTEELERVLTLFSGHLTIVRLQKREGLGNALAVGLQQCNCEWVIRMDSDDIATSDRCEKQLSYVQQHTAVDILSGGLAEFVGDSLTVDAAKSHVVSYKKLPTTNEAISKYIKYRNPMNHPCVLFRKAKVTEAGNYQHCCFFEDYDLWVRMFQKHCVFANLADVVLYMRVNEMHNRRGGMGYTKAIIHFQTNMYRRGIINFPQYICTTILRIAVSLVPNRIRKAVYNRRLRNH